MISIPSVFSFVILQIYSPLKRKMPLQHSVEGGKQNYLLMLQHLNLSVFIPAPTRNKEARST